MENIEISMKFCAGGINFQTRNYFGKIQLTSKVVNDIMQIQGMTNKLVIMTMK